MKGKVKGKTSLDLPFHRTPKAPPSSNLHIHLKTAAKLSTSNGSAPGGFSFGSGLPATSNRRIEAQLIFNF
jgi:hypothetical protein